MTSLHGEGECSYPRGDSVLRFNVVRVIDLNNPPAWPRPGTVGIRVPTDTPMNGSLTEVSSYPEWFKNEPTVP
jgi:hypothetical protein